MRKVLNFLICATAWIGGAALVLFGISSPVGGKMLVAALPLLYAFFTTLLVAYKNLWSGYYKFTVYTVLLLQWMRCVFLPVAGCFTDVYDSIIQGSNFYTIIALMVAELIAAHTVCFLLARKPGKNAVLQQGEQLRTEYNFQGTYLMYILFAVAAFASYYLMARGEKLFSFIFLDTEERVGDESTDSLTMIRTIVSTAMTFLSLSLIYRCSMAHRKTNKGNYVVWAAAVSCLMLCIIVGERRTRQLYLLFAYAIVLCSMFPKYQKRLLTSLLIVAGVVVGLMSIYKFYNAFLYDSYLEAMQKTDSDLASTVRTCDSYFYGFAVLNRNLTYIARNDLSMLQVLKDIGRNIFGVHYLFRGIYTTTEIYNLYWYAGKQATGYLFSSVGYGYLFFGILAPLVTVVNISVAAFLERQINRAKSIEWLYTYSYIFMRFAFGMFSSFPALLNSATRTLVVNCVVIFCSGIIMKKNKDLYFMPEGKAEEHEEAII